MRFVFHVLPRPAGKAGHFETAQVVRYARTVEEAYESAMLAVKAGDRIWCWYEDPDGACTLCGGPFHPATGHYESATRHWCGVCTRDMIQLLKQMLPRRWGGCRFYDHAYPPPTASSVVE